MKLKASFFSIEQLTVSHNTGRTVISKSMELVAEIIAEFVFCEINMYSDSRQSSSSNSNRVSKFKNNQSLVKY